MTSRGLKSSRLWSLVASKADLRAASWGRVHASRAAVRDDVAAVLVGARGVVVGARAR